MVGYKDGVAVGFLGCREAIPSLQRLAVYTTEALAELEQAVGIGGTPSPAAQAAGKASAPAPAKSRTKRRRLPED